MRGDDGCNIGHAAVAKLYAIFVTNFAKLVVSWKVFRQKRKKLLANVGFDAVAVRGVEPYHVSLSSSAFSFRLFLLKGETGRVATDFEGFVIQRDCLLNSSSLYDISDTLSAIMDGRYFFMIGGWFDAA